MTVTSSGDRGANQRPANETTSMAVGINSQLRWTLRLCAVQKSRPRRTERTPLTRAVRKQKHRTKQKTIADCRPTGSFRICFRFPLESTVSIKGRRGKGCGPARIISLIFVFVHPSFYEIFGRLRLFAIRMPWRWSREQSRGPWQGCGSIRMQFPHESDYSVVLIQTLSLIEMQTLKWEWTTL